MYELSYSAIKEVIKVLRNFISEALGKSRQYYVRLGLVIDADRIVKADGAPVEDIILGEDYYIELDGVLYMVQVVDFEQ